MLMRIRKKIIKFLCSQINIEHVVKMSLNLFPRFKFNDLFSSEIPDQ